MIFKYNTFILLQKTSKKSLFGGILMFFVVSTVYAIKLPNLDQIFKAIEHSSYNLIRLVFAITTAIGFFFVISAIASLKKVGQMSAQTQMHQGMSGPLIKFVIGILLIYFADVINIGMLSVFGTTSILKYNIIVGNTFSQVKAGAVKMMQVFGFIACVRGLLMLNNAANQGNAQHGSYSKGVIYIIGGILAINIVATMCIIGNSLGFSDFMQNVGCT